MSTTSQLKAKMDAEAQTNGPSHWSTAEAFCELVLAKLGGGGSFVISTFDSQTFSYFGATNNVETVVYKLGATTVAILTFTYVGGGASNDDNVATIVQS